MKIVEGDLLDLALLKEIDVIVHQCNCFHNFGAGIALAILRRYPEAFEADKTTPFGSREKLGTISTATVYKSRSDKGLTIVNGYSQYGCGVNKVRTEYEHVRSVFKLVKQLFSGKRIAYPLYGAGLAGGDWEIISKIIDEELAGENHTLVKWRRK